MGRRGPQPTPTAIKRRNGNPSKRRLNEAEPTPPPLGPAGLRPPYRLPARATVVWDRVVPLLAELGVLGQIDAEKLAMYCRTYARWQALAAAIEEQGETYELKTEMGTKLLPRPEVAIEGRLRRELVALGRDFGMTPSSRSSLALEPGKRIDPLEAFLSGKPRP